MRQIQQMVDWIEEHVEGDFSLENLAKEMNYSPYYCSVIFHQMTGITIRRYLLLRRLYQSTEQLRRGERILDSALLYGYSSQEAYSRAFKNLFGVTPKNYQKNPFPVQSIVKIKTYKGDFLMNITRKLEVQQLREADNTLFETDILNILNGQMMYDEFDQHKLMGNSDAIPFNEAMAVHQTVSAIFSDDFVNVRAKGHGTSNDAYRDKVIKPFEKIHEKQYKAIVLWFGEDVFCQMNALTILAYLEQIGFKGRVVLNSFREDEFKVNQVDLILGDFQVIYEQVLVQHQLVERVNIPLLYQAIQVFIEMLDNDNRVTKYIKSHLQLEDSELVRQLFKLFPEVGYGDTQYIDIINKLRRTEKEYPI